MHLDSNLLTATSREIKTMLFIDLLAIHAVCDWFLQNQWQADNKANQKHIAGYVHAGIHGLGCLIVLPWHLALFVAVTHWLIDLRLFIPWWRKLIGQGSKSQDVMLHMSFWQDQVLHFLVLYAVYRISL